MVYDKVTLSLSLPNDTLILISCVHSAGQCSTSQSIRHRLCARTRKGALECTVFTGKRVVENARQYSRVCDVYINQITPFYPEDYVPHARRRFTVSYEMKTNFTWIYSVSHFANVEGTQGFIVGLIFVFSLANGKPQWPIRAKKDIYYLDMANFIDRVCSRRGMNKEESKVKIAINYGRSLL